MELVMYLRITFHLRFFMFYSEQGKSDLFMLNKSYVKADKTQKTFLHPRPLYSLSLRESILGVSGSATL